MLVAEKNKMQFYIQDEDAEGFRMAGYKLYKQELVPISDDEVEQIRATARSGAVLQEESIEIAAQSESVEPRAHNIEGA